MSNPIDVPGSIAFEICGCSRPLVRCRCAKGPALVAPRRPSLLASVFHCTAACMATIPAKAARMPRLLAVPGHIAAVAYQGWVLCRALVVEWRCRVRSRRELLILDDHDLWDLGLTRSHAQVEASKRFWRE